ncbi:MAG: hypothetical protein G01um101416_44 [Microgenomates group bacterium Gr01-1014_16]|nr:MAG: hypothetical protein G01um101416_44 [Microgenomates group bacterium Gr01-1014_16]
MKKIAILSYYSGVNNRGVESWSKNVQDHVKGYQIDILNGSLALNPFYWIKYDLIIPTNGRFQSVLARLLSWTLRKPLVIFSHSGPGADDKWNLLCCPNTFVCFTRAQAVWAARFKLPWTKIEVVPHAVDINTFTPGTKPKKPVVLCVAANHPAKRVKLVSSAIKLLPGVKLRIVGPGQPEQVPFEKMPEIYKNANVFCFVPQPWEAFGLVFLEAMASNLPVVTSNDPIRREIIGNAGKFVSHPENPAELAAVIRTALSRDWGNLPRSQAEKFSWDKITQKYDQLIRGHHR